jgi:hypothetical protein
MKENHCQPRLLYPAKQQFITEEEIKAKTKIINDYIT